MSSSVIERLEACGGLLLALGVLEGARDKRRLKDIKEIKAKVQGAG